MPKNQPDATPKQDAGAVQKDQGQEALKNQNPNHNHSTKKVALGPNTKR